MIQARIYKNKLEIFVQNKSDAQTLQKSLSCFEPGYQHNPLYRMGRYDGLKKFYTVKTLKDGWLFFTEIGFISRVEKLLDITISQPKKDIQCPITFLKKEIPLLPFVPYKHQLQLFMGLVKNTNHLGISATSSGKSLVIYLITKYYTDQKKSVVIVVPTIDLTAQLYSDFEAYNAEQVFMDSIQQIGGENNNKILQHPVIITTWQSAMNIKWDYDIVLCDEAHLAKNDQLQKILGYPFEKKLGITGSMPVVELDAMTLESKFNTPKRYINATGLIKLGLATNVTIIAIFLNQKVKIMKYQDEVKFIKESTSRRNFISQFSNKLKGLSFFLYQHTKHGEDTFESFTGVKLTNKLKNDFNFMKSVNTFFISGATKSSIRKLIREHLETSTENNRVIGQISVLSTGINIKRLKHLVYLSSSKSYTQTLQSIGRVLRLHEEKGNNVYVYDLVDVFSEGRKTENFALRHFWVRCGYYDQEEFSVLEYEIDLKKY